MPPKHKIARQSKVKHTEDERPNEREQRLEVEVEALKKELSKKDGIHRDELRAAETALDAQSQKHYFDVLDERDQLQKQVTGLQAKLDEKASDSTGDIRPRSDLMPHNTSSTTTASQGLPRKIHILQLIDQHTHRKEKLHAELIEMTEAIEDIRAENDTKRHLISEMKAEARPTRDRPGTHPYERGPLSQNTPSNMSSNKSLPGKVDPATPFSAAARPSLTGNVQAARRGGKLVGAHAAYSKVGGRRSRKFRSVNTHVEDHDRRQSNQSATDPHQE